MGEMVEVNGRNRRGSAYLSLPDTPAAGVVVIQEWWGLVDHIKLVCERFAHEGFVAIAPDLFKGERTSDPDRAEKLMLDLVLEDAAVDMAAAVDYLIQHEKVIPKKIGSVGFCMGGALSLVLGTVRPVDGVVTYYGLPDKAKPDYSKLRGGVLGHFAELDEWASPGRAEALFHELRRLGKDSRMHVYAGTSHAFFNDDRQDSYDRMAAELSWQRTVAFLRTTLAD